MSKQNQHRRFKGSAGNNRKIGEDFLLQNAKKDGVFETDSGLQYQIIEETSGEKPQIDSRISMHQRVLLLQGTILEDSYKTNKPVEVTVNELLEGLQEGILLQSIGSRYRFWLPPDLAWGKKGSTDRIPPYAVIQFDIRLLDILNI